MTSEQICKAMSEIPQEYWNLDCWSFREKGRTDFTCPILTVPQRIFFAYRFYINQVTRNPTLVEWYNEKKAALKREVTKTGSKPTTPGRGTHTSKAPRP